MDVQTALIGAATFIVSAGILLLIALFGMKEKSYEEALAEQRQQTNSLLGPQVRPKPKEKKAKKANKKAKEKQAVVIPESETAEESEDTESPSTSSTSSAPQNSQKLHVEFKEPVNVSEGEANVVNKKEEAVVKESKEKLTKVKQNPVNQDNIKEKNKRQSAVENKENKSEQHKEKNVKKEEKQATIVDVPQKPNKLTKAAVTAVEKQESVEIPTTTTPPTNTIPINVPKEKKKKKNETHTLQQITGSKDGEINLPLLLNAVRNAELSRSEVQILIDLLLNKQHEAPVVLDEWSEGKADPIQKLKKQLAEKEKALSEEQEALLGVQAKLKEIRNEQVAEKSQLQQRTRNLEESLQAKHLELQAINNRWHNQNQKMQQMQAQLTEEGLAIRKLREENAALQLQRQQLDIHIVQTQEAEATIQDLQGRNNQLTLELHSLNDQLASKDHQQGVIVQLQHQVNHFKSEIDEKENFIRQFEDIRRDFEHRLGVAHRQENELKVEVSQLNSVCQQNAEEIRRLDHGKSQAFEELKNLQKQKEELQLNVAQLKRELLDAQEEQSLKANGLAQEDENHKEELLNLRNELSSVKSELHHVKTSYAVELEASKNSLSVLQSELTEQKNKNNEILSTVRSEVQDSNKQFVERLFPEIKVPQEASYDNWTVNMGNAIQKYISELEKSKTNDSQSESTKLQAQVQHYKTIIDDTEGILKKLQNHVEQEEIHWRRELKAKELEIEGLKQHYISELHKKVTEVQQQLHAEQEKQKLSEQINRPTDKETSISNENSSHLETNNVLLKEQISTSTNGSVAVDST